MSPQVSPWAAATRRGIVPIVLGILCFIASAPAIEDLDPLLKNGHEAPAPAPLRVVADI